MAEYLTAEDLEAAHANVATLGEVVNGDNQTMVESPSGEVYPSLANALYTVIQAGGFEPFQTQAALLASVPTVPKKAAKALDTKKVWYWDGSAWVDTGLSELDLAKNYADEVASDAKNYTLRTSNKGLYANKAFIGQYENHAKNKFGGYISKTTGALVNNGTWYATDYIAVTETSSVMRDGLVIGDASSGCSLAYYDENKEFLGYYIDSAAMFSIKPVDIYPNTKYVRLGYQASSNTKIYLYEPSVTAFVDDYVMPFVGKPTNVAGSMTVGYATKTDGSFVDLAGWGITDFIAVDATSLVTRDADPVATSSAVAPIACYDANKNYLGYVQNIDRTEKLKIGRKFPTVKFIRVSVASPSSISYAVYIQTQAAVNINDQVKALDILNSDFFTASDVATGYITLTGGFVSSANWRTTSLLPCKPGQVFTYSGRGNATTVSSISLWDGNGVFLESIYANSSTVVDQKFTINNANARYVRATSQSTVTYKFIGIELPKNLSKQYSIIVPTEVYALKNEPIYLYADGVVGNADNVAWNISEANQKVCKITPATATSIPVQLQTTEDLNVKKTLASFNVVVTDTPVNPTAKRYLIALGDSLTDGTANSSIQGAWPNECSRRLNGVGFQILANEYSPSPLTMSNLEFIGTRGDNAVKHEGRGGWRASHYLNNESVSGAINAFWNPATSQFDMSYYLTQNGFTGIDASGSNLTVVILLGWNDVYNSTAKQAAIDLGLLIDKIRSNHANTDIICLGLNQAPEINFKTFTGNRFISKREVFESIKQFNDEYKAMIATKTNVDFLQISCVFNSEIGYNKSDFAISSRSAEKISGVADHVHPNATGYSMIADAVFYKLIYKYCRG